MRIDGVTSSFLPRSRGALERFAAMTGDTQKCIRQRARVPALLAARRG